LSQNYFPSTSLLNHLKFSSAEDPVTVYVNKKTFQRKFISKNTKLKLYFSVITAVVTYACETWILKETITNRLKVFERKILREIFGPTYEN
jgi:hypothetical protein